MPLFNDKTVIPCEQCRRLVRVPTNRGSIKVRCPHCQATFILTPDLLITKKKCLNCGYERQEKDDHYGIIPSTECPKCHAVYEKVEKYLIEKERSQEQEQQKQEERETKEYQEKYRKDLEKREKLTKKGAEDDLKVVGMKFNDWFDRYFIYIFMAAFFIAYLVFGTWSDVSYTKGWDEISWTRKGLLGW